MRRCGWFWLVALMGLTLGCCQNPGVFAKAKRSLETVQSFYGPMLQQEGWHQDEKVRQAVVAADTALLLAGELQRQWCPEPGQAAQLELQVSQAQKLAEDAGVKEVVAPANPPNPGK